VHDQNQQQILGHGHLRSYQNQQQILSHGYHHSHHYGDHHPHYHEVEVPHAVAEWIAEVVAFFASIDAFVYTPPESPEQK